MTTRTRSSEIEFLHPFEIEGLTGLQIPGKYRIEIDEEVVEGNQHTVYVRIGMAIEMLSPGRRMMVPITPSDLEAALNKDKQLSHLQAGKA